MKTLTMTTGKNIHIYDDLFEQHEKLEFYLFTTRSMYNVFGSDTSLLEYSGDRNIYSNYSEQDVENMGFLKHPKIKQILEKFKNIKFKQARVNLSTLNDKNHFHIDTRGVTFLYYPNINWDIEWGGYTLFSNEDLTEIEHCVTYTPGRLVVFDGTIPHCIAAPTNIAPSYRFSFAVQFEYVGDECQK